MPKKDRVWEEIERTSSAPLISVNWSAPMEDILAGRGDRHGLRDCFRKIRDEAKRWRARTQNTEMGEAANKVYLFLKYYQGRGRQPGFSQTTTGILLNDFADWCEHRGGEIDLYAQDVLRECCHKVANEEMVDR